MAEPESILQLGIEAAREGKKEEARQLFRLLTQQEPDNAQGWLWLAGVAENREERQHSLERVLDLDPSNEMALKGLQALGAAPGDSHTGVVTVPANIASGPIVPPPPARDEDPFDDDDPFAELNSLSETMAADTSGPVRRVEADPALHAEVAAGSAASAAARAEASARRSEERMRENRRETTVVNDEYEPARRGFSPLLGLLLFLVGLGLIGLLIAFLWPNLFGGGQDTASNSAAQTAVAQTSEAGGLLGGAVTPNAGESVPTLEPGAPTPEGAVPGAPTPEGAVPGAPTPEGAVPGAGEQPVPPTDPITASPAIVGTNTPLQSEGWLYDFNQPTFAASIIGNIGQFAPNNGRFVVVLAFAVNNTGSAQAIPGNFFVLKDAQGRVWEARPDVSAAYVVPGVNADLAHTQPFPADGITRSVALIFDVAPDATDLVFFARSNPGQGWMVLRSV